MVPPTWTSAGLAPTLSMLGQTFSVPETRTLPVRGASLQVSATATGTVLPASTSNVAEPAQLLAPSVVVAEIAILKPVPAGRPPMIADSVVDPDRAMVPLLVKPFGPLMV